MALSTDAVLAAIRAAEGNPGYSAKPSGSGSASGAYQFTDSTWKANGGTTAHAWQASKAEQDTVATRKAQAALAGVANGTDQQQLAAIAQSWYLGHPASPAELNTVPGKGNHKTVAQYTADFVSSYQAALGGGGGGGGGWGGSGGGGILKAAGTVAGAIVGGAGDAAGAVAGAVVDPVVGAIEGFLGDLVDPFLDGLRKLSIIGLATLLGVGLLGVGAYRTAQGSR